MNPTRGKQILRSVVHVRTFPEPPEDLESAGTWVTESFHLPRRTFTFRPWATGTDCFERHKTGDNMFKIESSFTKILTIVFILAMVAIAPLKAGQLDPVLYAGMQWRMVGPFRAGR